MMNLTKAMMMTMGWKTTEACQKLMGFLPGNRSRFAGFALGFWGMGDGVRCGADVGAKPAQTAVDPPRGLRCG